MDISYKDGTLLLFSTLADAFATNSVKLVMSNHPDGGLIPTVYIVDSNGEEIPFAILISKSTVEGLTPTKETYTLDQAFDVTEQIAQTYQKELNGEADDEPKEMFSSKKSKKTFLN